MPDNVLVIEPNQRQLAQLKQLLAPTVYKQALYAAVKRTTDTGKTQVSSTLRTVLLAKKKYLDDALNAEMVSNDPPIGKIRIEHDAIPASAFKYTASKRNGVTIRFRNDKPPVKLRHAFVATVRRGTKEHKGIFMRERIAEASGAALAKAGAATSPNGPKLGIKYYKKKFRGRTERVVKLGSGGFVGRLPIEQVWGPTAYSLAREGPTFDAIMAKLRETMSANLEKNIQSQIKRFAGQTTGAAA